MRLSTSTQAVLLLLVCVGAALLVTAVAFVMRSRAQGREQAANALCAALDSYVEAVIQHDTRSYDPQVLWNFLQQARALKRQHFPELYAEMMEFSKVHGELTAALLHCHLQLHGAPMGKLAVPPSKQLEVLRVEARQTVTRLKLRCRETAEPARARRRR